MKVKVLDAIMGSGKTQRLIGDVAKLTNPVIYITPLLSECHRFAGTVVDENGVVVNDELGLPYYDMSHPLSNKRFKHPNNRNKFGSKIESLLQMVRRGDNIVSTHALFRSLTKEVVNEIIKHEYILIIDEALTVWERYLIDKTGSKIEGNIDCTRTDKEIISLIESGIIEVDPVGILHWQWDNFPTVVNTHYEETAMLCDNKQLVMVNGSVVLWEYPIWVLESFKEIWIATYRFEGSMFSEYLKIHNVAYSIDKFGSPPSEYKPLITVLDDAKLNACGESTYALSYSALCIDKHNTHLIDTLKKNLANFFRHKTKSKKEERLWSTFSQKKGSISGGKYSGCWLSYNTKATNEYKDAKYIAYMVNVFANTGILAMLKHRACEFSQEEYALSIMVQFIWRSAIRDKKPIVVYIPSKRMRNIFLNWLNEESL